MKLTTLLIPLALFTLPSCTSEEATKPKRPDTRGMSGEAAKMWEDGVQFGRPSPGSEANAREAAKAFEIGIPPATLPPASRNPMNGLQVR